MQKIDLEYKQQAYKEIYSAAFVTEFNHGSMVQGSIDVRHVKEIVAKLNERIAHVTKAIYFKPEVIEERLVGGSCSSIALRVSHVALKYLQQPESNSKGLIETVKNIVETINVLNSSGRKEVRNVQAAFNTIHVETSVKVDDICQEKIKALAAHFDMRVCESTEELLIEQAESCEREFNETITRLKAGVYLVRILQKEDNHKLETQGHSTVYIKDDHGTELYFDTQLGLYNVRNAQDLIHRSICSAKKRFAVDAYKFHQLII